MRDANKEPAALLCDANDRPMILTGVAVRGRLTETLASVEVEQRYLNPFGHNIEAVYTFPLPIGAVLLDMTVDIDGRTLSGQVVERKAAERQYEEAITDGNSAVMLTDDGNGLYTMNLGNLMAHEPAVIRYRYAMALLWLGDRLRLLIPTTIAPRYGNPQDAGLEDWETPETDLFVEYPFDLIIAIEGSLADCEVGSATHLISVGREASGLQVKLNRRACLDRDFVLTVRSGAANRSTFLISNDGSERVAFASLRILPVQREWDGPLCLKVLIDCSGSMNGSSIAQARKGALAILEQLRPIDYVNVTFFGSRHEHIFPQLMPCNSTVLDLFRERLGRIEADMGGTETAKALDAVYKISGEARQSFAAWQAEHWPGSPAAILLITDGEIWDVDGLLQRATQSGHRIFTVGVGMAVGESLITELANATGGACELVAPQEGMGERILAQFHRIRQARITPIELRWDETPLWQTPVPGNLFSGDTVTVFAGFKGKGPTQLSFSGGATGSVAAVHAEIPDIPRLAAHARIKALGQTDEKLVLDLALRHQLLTRRTNFVVIAERNDKAEDLPDLVKVPHMMPAGMFESDRRPNCCALDFDDMEDDIPFGALEQGFFRQTSSPVEFIDNLSRRFAGSLRPKDMLRSIGELEHHGLPGNIAATLREWSTLLGDEASVVAAFLHALSESVLGRHFARGLRRLVVTAWKGRCTDPALKLRLEKLLAAVSDSAWNWVSVQSVAVQEVVSPPSPRSCADCGCTISSERLQAFPNAGRCVKCQGKYELTHDTRRKVDEGLAGTRADNVDMRLQLSADMRNRGRGK